MVRIMFIYFGIILLESLENLGKSEYLEVSWDIPTFDFDWKAV